nr:MAG TPA: hypothetical protein [Caudoviricetes sp.]
MYHWTLDYTLDCLTLPQVAFFYNQAVLFYNPDSDPKPDKKKFHEAYGENEKISR